MYMNGSPEVRYRIINETISKDDNLLNISYLCQIAGVSRSGFYYWRSHHSERTAAEEADRRDFDLIVAAYNFRGYSKGARGIHMRLLHQDPPVLMNTKKIRRLMKKYHLVCPVRKVNPYRKQGKRLQENRTAPNILNRQFKAFGPRMVLLTDITYIPRPTHRESSERAYRFSYVCVIMDAFTKEVLACSCSSSCDTDFVLEAVNQLMEKHGSELKTDALIHSDQGCQYTSSKFVTILNNCNLRQSMSRRGNCWDNAPQESLFGHMKDELPAVGSYGHAVIAEQVYAWIDYYNNDRYQWSLAKLSPCEYYKFVTNNGDFLFLDNHFVFNAPLYVEADSEGELDLTPYARSHMDECCLAFNIKIRGNVSESYHTECFLNREYREGDITFELTYHNGWENSTNERRFEMRQKQMDEELSIRKRMTDDPEQCIELLLEWRNTNYTELGKLIGRDPKTISRTINGKTNPQFDTAALICFGLKLPPIISEKLLEVLKCKPSISDARQQWINEALRLKYPEPLKAVKERHKNPATN